VKTQFWLTIKGKEDIFPGGSTGYQSREECLKARAELVKQGTPNREIVTVITVEED